MKRRPFYPNFLVLFLLLFAVVSVHGFAQTQLKEQAVTFQLNEKTFQVLVRLSGSGTGSDIFLEGPGIKSKNLSFHFPGENLFPVVTVNQLNNRFMISWMHYCKGNVQLCLYDSFVDDSRWLALENFTSANPLAVIFNDEIPILLLFKGNNSDNTDIFYYHLGSGSVVNITGTPDSEQRIDIFDEENRVFIEAETLFHHYRYRIKKRNLKVTLTKKKAFEFDWERHQPAADQEGLAINTMVGFGDSITWGRMNMYSLVGDYHPELAYLARLQEIFAVNYGQTYTINLSVPGDRTIDAIDRMDEDFSGISAFFCLVMLGTNDVANGDFDADASVENLEFIVTTARDFYHMYPVISTIPPQRRYHPTLQYFKENTETLNTRIMEMAAKNQVPYIDTYTAFMEHPEGWVALLEDIKGNHPNPEGHLVIANLFKEKILELPPAVPQDIVPSDTSTSSQTLTWSDNREFDFSHYYIEFGYFPDQLNRNLVTFDSFYTFIVIPLHAPFNSKLYFRIQSVDKDGNTSEFTPIQRIDFD
jgi:lysophospholipase L1-like esterase